MPRLAASRLKELLNELRIVVVNGPRQCGKTTLLQSCRRFGDATFATLDDPSQLAIARDDPRTFARQQPQPVIID
ncbi:AAA family ATPase [Nonomuraea ferruginea]|uniref:AAA family ATPase n=1 Tax=Nonomuraea ferruginea TaxID=46174 RepID=A0ABT4SQS8_9ACTN|nr:AAA family ATPase [Nonomuraea ferruginea]MDA0639206.1 AAA family ATPase [Nonomuraea ferruginea]